MSSRKKLKAVALNSEVAAGAAREGPARAGFPAAHATPDREMKVLAKWGKLDAAHKLAGI